MLTEKSIDNYIYREKKYSPAISETQNGLHGISILLIGEGMGRLTKALIAVLFLGVFQVSFAAVEVSVSGSTTALPLIESAAEIFNFKQTDYHISVVGGGTGVGINNVAEGRSDLAMASREVKPQEKAIYGDRFRQFLVGYDGIGIAVSRAVYEAGITDLSKDQVMRIYAGDITNWKQIGGPDEGIYVIGREQGSGTLDTFNEVIMGSTTAESPGVRTVASSNAEVKTAIVGSDKAIGYLGYSFVQGGNLDLVALNGILPTAETIRSGNYSLARKLYLVSFGNPSPAAQAFIDFMIGPQGQEIAVENGFIPITNLPMNNSTSAAAQGNETKANPPVDVRQQNNSQPAKSQPGFDALSSAVGVIAVLYIIQRRK